jgi:hypothetical protein
MILRRALERGQPHASTQSGIGAHGLSIRRSSMHAGGPERRLPGVDAGAQTRAGPDEACLAETANFQRIRALKPPGVTAAFGPGTTHNRELAASNAPPRTRQPPTRPARVPKRSGRPVRGERLVEGVEPSVLHHAAHVCGGIDSLERVPLHQHQVGQLARPERAQVLIQAQLPCGRGRASPPSGSSSPISNRSRLNMVARPL